MVNNYEIYARNIKKGIQVQTDFCVFIVSQLVMFYSVFGALSIYNKAYAKEQDRIDSLYKMT